MHWCGLRVNERLRKKARRVPCFRGPLRIRCVAETTRGRESMFARLSDLAAGYHEGNHRVAARSDTARRITLSRPDGAGRERFYDGGAAKASHPARHPAAIVC